MQVFQPHSQPAGQDRRDFPLGSSPARPAAGYFASAAGVEDEKVFHDAIVGLTSYDEIHAALSGVFKNLWRPMAEYQATSFMKWRLRMTK